MRADASVAGEDQTRKTATPIMMYSVVHTGPNIQLGGEKSGFMIVSYHVGIAAAVNAEPIPPASNEPQTAIRSFAQFGMFML